MGGIHPVCLLGRFGRSDVEVDDDGFLIATNHDAGQRFVVVRIDLLMRDKRRHVDEVAGPGFGHEFEALSPPHPRGRL
jgi:hypothetical protein